MKILLTLLQVLGWALLILLGLLFLLLLLPARVRLRLKAEKLFLWVGLGPIMFRLLPPKEKKPRAGKRRKMAEQEALAPEPAAVATPPDTPESQKGQDSPARVTREDAPQPGESPGGKGRFSLPKFPKISVEFICEMARFALDAMGKFTKLLVVRRLFLHATIATGDAATTAMAYGGASAAVHTLLPSLEERLRIRKQDILIECDFEGQQPQIELDIEISALVLSMLITTLCLLVRFLKLMKKNKKEKAVQP